MDVITHVTNLDEFRAEAKQLAFAVDEQGRKLVKDLYYNEETDELIYGVSKIPVIYKEGTPVESITLIRAEDDSDLAHFNYMVRLGKCVDGEYIFDTPEAKAEYERVHDTSSYVETAPDGSEVEVTKPYQIGVFL